MGERISFFWEETERVLLKLEEKRDEADLIFAVVADSHLDDFEEETLANIRAVDSKLQFDFLAHLGDFMNGNLPREYTRRILKIEMDKYRAATEKGVFYPAQGNHDGHFEMGINGTCSDVALDEDWYAATSFTENYPNLKREGCKPYYYVDYPEKKVRIIVLCSFSYEWTAAGKYRKLYRMDLEQLDWFKKEALALEAGWTIILFSHDGPLTLYDQEKFAEEPWNENNKELLDILLEKRNACEFSVAAWFIGHWHGDVCQTVEGIPFVLIGSQTCYVPQLWLMPETGDYEKRERGTVTQDLWDAVTLNVGKRELYLCRFGAGKDRVIRY